MERPMSGRLIALNRADVERTTPVNPDHIVAVDRPSEDGSYVSMSHMDKPIFVKETPEQISQMMDAPPDMSRMDTGYARVHRRIAPASDSRGD
jgi:hypothetical protein